MQDSQVSLANTAQATMKLRFKGEDCALGGTSKGFSLQVDDNCDWCQLQEAISRQCPYLESFSPVAEQEGEQLHLLCANDDA